MARTKLVLSADTVKGIRAKVKQFLEDTGLSREFVSEAAGLSSSYLRVFLLGFCGITIQTAMRLALAMRRLNPQKAGKPSVLKSKEGSHARSKHSYVHPGACRRRVRDLRDRRRR